MNVDKILIRGPNWVGDSVLAIPAIKALRTEFPKANITLLVRPWVAGLFSSVPFVDRVWRQPKPAGIADWARITQEIRRDGFDLAVLLPNSFESALMMFLGGVPVRLGYATDGRSLLLTNAIDAPDRDNRHQVEYYLDLVKKISTTTDTPSIEIAASAEERSAARDLLAKEGVPANERFLVLNPGAAYGSAKRWSEERFAMTGDVLARRFGLHVVVVGSPSETAAAESIRSHSNTRVAVLTGKTSLETLIGVLAESSLLITNDSGPMHISAALGTPTVAIFGPTDDRVTAPVSKHARIVKHPVDCSPCLLRECPIDHRCMTRISVEDVCRAAEDLLADA